MKNFIAKLIFSIEIVNETTNPQFDEQVRLIHANSEEEAYFKAKKLGKDLNNEFKNNRGNFVKWQFVDVSELWPAPDFSDGAILHTSTIEPYEKQSFIKSILQKAMSIQSKHLHFA